MVKNWNYRAYQNATELKTFGVIRKFVSWWVRKNCEKNFVASFSPKKWPKMVKNWNFGTRQNAPELNKIGAIGKLLPWWVRKKLKNFLSRHFYLQNNEKQWKMVKNWNFWVWQNATELQNFGAICKLLPLWVRKNNKFFVAAPFSPSKRWITVKIGQKLKFSDMTKLNRATKIWCHLKAFAMMSKKNYKILVVKPFLPSKLWKPVKIWSKIEIFVHDKMRWSSKNFLPFTSFRLGQ